MLEVVFFDMSKVSIIRIVVSNDVEQTICLLYRNIVNYSNSLYKTIITLT